MAIRLPENKTWIIVAVIIIVCGAWIASKLEYTSATKWTDNSREQNKNKGSLFGLSALLKAQLPHTQQVSLDDWSEFSDSDAATSTGQLLFVDTPDKANLADYQAMLNWVAIGNHVVLPIPESREIRNFKKPRSSKNTNKSTWEQNPSVPYEKWLHQDLGVDLEKIDKTASKKLPETASSATQSACERALTRIQEARQQTKDEEGKSPPALSNDEIDDFMQNCTRQLNDIALPEGMTIAWLDNNSVELKPLPNANVLWQGKGLSGSHIVRLAYGKGSVVLISSINPLGNPQDPSVAGWTDLNRFDHAYLARYLAQGKTRLIFVHKMYYPINENNNLPLLPWWRIVQKYPLPMALLLLSIVLLVWRFGLRLGAVHAPSTEETLDLTTYLHAQGQFLAHHGTVSAKLNSMQAVLTQQWQTRWANWSQLSHNAKQVLLHDYYPNATDADLALWLNAIPHGLTESDWLDYLRAHQRMTHFSGNLPQ